MKQCVICGRTYADVLEFCTEDGTRLTLRPDSEATQISGTPTAPTTQVWQPLPPPNSAPQWPSAPLPVQPVPPPKRSIVPIILYSLVALVAVIGGALGIIAFFNSQNNNNSSARNNPPPVNRSTPEVIATPDFRPTPRLRPTPDEKPTPETRPTPKPKPTLDSDPTPAPPVKGGCTLQNDDPSQPDVNLRANCHVKQCDNDKSTLIGNRPNGTPITVSREVAPVSGKSFMWQQIRLGNGTIAWVAASKIKCN